MQVQFCTYLHAGVHAGILELATQFSSFIDFETCSLTDEHMLMFQLHIHMYVCIYWGIIIFPSRQVPDYVTKIPQLLTFTLMTNQKAPCYQHNLDWLEKWKTSLCATISITTCRDATYVQNLCKNPAMNIYFNKFICIHNYLKQKGQPLILQCAW